MLRVAWSPDGRLLASGVLVLQPVRLDEPSSVQQAAHEPDAGSIIPKMSRTCVDLSCAGSADHTVRFWAVSTSPTEHSYTGQHTTQHSATPCNACLAHAMPSQHTQHINVCGVHSRLVNGNCLPVSNSLAT